MIKQIIKYGIYISCFIAFIYFSWQSVAGFINGDVVYDVVNQNEAQPGFPSVTLCPMYKKSMANLKTTKMKSDFGLTAQEIESITIFTTLGLRNTTALVENYSFSSNETLLDSTFSTHEYNARAKFVSEEKYQEEKEDFSKCINDGNSTKFGSCEDPIIFKEINTPLGKCFYLYSDEKATTEQKFQGL